MVEFCANQDCHEPFDYRHGRLFRFHKDCPVGGKPPNTHSVQHFWLCSACCDAYTLEYREGWGVVIKGRSDIATTLRALRFIASD